MKINGKFLFGTILFLSGLINPLKIYADSIGTITGYIFPEIDFRYVEFLPNGHLHKNKPHYGKYNWKVLESAHFQLYVYGQNDELANLYLQEAEKTFREYGAKMNTYGFSEKIRIIIFNSQRDFEEANLIFGLVPKGLGGETEMLKWKRVLIAFRDSPVGFRRLLRHELTHRYQGEFIKLTMINFWYQDTPLWFIEGSAEHFSHEWDSRGELTMRDAYLNNYLAHVTGWSPWYTSLVYKEGEFILHFLADQYKDKGEVTSAILKESTEMKFAEAFKKVTGDSLEEFDKKLQKHINEKYGPLKTKSDATEEANSLTDGAILASKGNYFISRKDVFGRETLFLNWTNGNEIKSKKLADGGRLKSVDVKGFEVELSPEFGFQENGAVFASTSTVIYALNKGGRDTLIFQNFSFGKKRKGKFLKFFLGQSKEKFHLEGKEEYSFANLRDIQYPAMINDKEVAFVGRENIFSELYKFNLKTKELKRLTSARRTYRGLTYSKWLDALITSVENEKTESYNLAKYDFKKNTLELLNPAKENEFSATASTDGKKLLYVSDKDLVNNICMYDFENQTVTRLTDAKIGVFRPQWFSENGIIFNSFSRGNVWIKIIPLPKSNLAKSKQEMPKSDKTDAVKISSEPASIIDSFKKLIPNSESLTIFATAASSDNTKMLLIENRKLSMEILKRGDPEIRFYLADKTANNVNQFTLKEFKRMKDFTNVALLAGQNILLQKSNMMVEKVNKVKSNGENESREEEVNYKESYIYNPPEQKLYKLDTEISSRLLGKSRFLIKISPERSHIFWVDQDQKNITGYDVLKKEKQSIDKSFSKLQDLVFLSETKLLVLEKSWHSFEIDEVEAGTDTVKTWKEILSDDNYNLKNAAWYPITDKKKVFFIAQKKNSQSFDLLLYDLNPSSLTLVQSEIPNLEKIELQNGKLTLNIKNEYGVEKSQIFDENGGLEKSEEKLSYVLNNSSSASHFQTIPLLERTFPADINISTRQRELKKLPRVMHAYGEAAIAFGERRGVSTYLALQALAFDELNNKAVDANIILQEGTYGLADVVYYDFNSGRSYLLDYWHFDQDRQRLDVGISQNIFLHEFLNLDATLKEEHVRNDRDSGKIEWWRTKIGTSLSLDTTINDWHGPHSGAAVFSQTELGFDNNRGYQSIDLNLDARYYLPFTERSGLAFRLAGGESFGKNPTIFIWGGNKTFRGIPMFSQAGNAYALQSTDLRIPVIDAIGAVFSGPVGEAFVPLTLYMDVRGGIYNDMGDIWYTKNPLFDGHTKPALQQSAGVFLNIPTALGFNLRFNKGFMGKKGWNLWLGYNW